MTQFLIAASNALHTLAAFIFIGHYLLLSLIYLPALTNPDAGAGVADAGSAFGQISRRSRSWMYAAIVIFMLTGIYLMIADANYEGIGSFSSPWAILMLVKHLLILAMIVMGFWFNVILRVGPAMRSSSGAAQAVARFRRYSNAMALCGVVVLLLTALAQGM